MSLPLEKRSFLTDFLLIVLLTAVLIAPVFRMEFSDRWSSIESTFIADARFLRDHWVHPNWQPLWYSGTRTNYVYPPALRYGTAALSKWTGVSTARAYHWYIGVTYCLGVAGVYFFVRRASGSRVGAWLAAAGVALVSPSFLLMPEIRADAPFLEPQRYGVLVRYGEGPHISSLAWVTVALAFAWRAMERWRWLETVLAAAGCALVVANNFYGATALAILFPIAVWAAALTHGDPKVLARAGVIAAGAYGLCAFWLTPSFIAVTLRNMQYVASKGNPWSIWAGIAAVVFYAAATYRRARQQPHLRYAVFVAGAALFFALNVLGLRYFGFRIIGEPARHVPELDLALLLAGAELARVGFSKPRLRRATAVLVAVAFAPSLLYVRDAWKTYRPDAHPEARVEYQLAHWAAEHVPNSRVLVTGSTRFWYDTWNDLQQVGGGSDQGILNGASVPAMWEFVLGSDGELARMWLQVLGTDAAIINGQKSQDAYRDHHFPYKYRGVLPVLYDNGKDDVVYAVPRRYRSLARVVDGKALDAIGPVVGNGTKESLAPYVALLENGPEAPTETRWISPEELEVRAPVAAGQTVFVQVSYDTPWRAYAGGRELEVRKSALGYMRIDAPPGQHVIRMVHGTPAENTVGAWLTALTVAVFAGIPLVRRRTPIMGE